MTKKATIQLEELTALELNKLKESLSETYEDVIKKLIKCYKKFKEGRC